MSAMCKLSCGNCQAPTTTTTTTTKTPQPTGDCKDVYEESCPYYARLGFCERYVKYMRTNCKKTCGACPAPTTATTPTPQPTGSSSSCQCGKKKPSTSRIVGGLETEVNEYPWMAAVMWV